MALKDVGEMGKVSQILFDENIMRDLTPEKVVVSKRDYDRVVELLDGFAITIEVKD